MSVNFHPFQYNDEYLYEKNKKSSFNIEFDKFFFFNEQKEEEDSFNSNQLYFIIMITITRIISVYTTNYSINGNIIPYNTPWGIAVWVLLISILKLKVATLQWHHFFRSQLLSFLCLLLLQSVLKALRLKLFLRLGQEVTALSQVSS